MLLPEDIIRTVNYYHYSTDYREFAIEDVVTIYFKPWWKLKKKYRFRRIVHCDMFNNTFYTRSEECVELLNQLRCHLYNDC
jgi:hypothetical protein